MYQNFYYSRKDGLCHLWDDEDGYKVFPFEPYAYQIDSKGDYETITGLKVKKVKSWSKEAEKQGLVFEHDVPIATRVLIDRYYQSDEPSKDHRVLFFDIEIEKGLRYSTPKDALNRITSIAYYFNNQYVCLLLDENNRLEDCTKTIIINGKEVPTIVKRFGSEHGLLNTFVSQWQKIKPTIVSAWNGEVFDIPYLIRRVENVLGYKYMQKFSPIGIVERREIGKRDIGYKIAGVSFLDYMQLYKKFTYNEEPSYALDFICKKELKRGKYVYEGTLDDLFNNDIDGFIEYNVNDVELMVALDKKMDLIEIARGICHKGHVPYEDFIFPSQYLEGAILTRCKINNLVSTSNLDKTVLIEIERNEGYIKDIQNGFVRIDKLKYELKDNTKVYIINDDNEFELIGIYFLKKQSKKKNTLIITASKAKGAFVKPPKVGLHKWVYSVDLQSLYPSLIRTCNISPETQMYFIANWYDINLVACFINDGNLNKLKEYQNFGFLNDDVVLELHPIIHELFSDRDNKTIQMSKSEFIEFMDENNYIISAHGVIYHTKFKGIIPSILEMWFNERLHYKDLAKQNKENNELYQYYDRKQLITKILLNSLYGVLLLPTFRYYNRMNGESVTLGGQNVIKFSDLLGTHFYCKKLNVPTIESPVIAGDTDSGYFSATPLLDLTKTDDQIIKDLDQISNEVTDFINKGVTWLSHEHFRTKNNYLKFMQEKLIKTAFWGQAKKRYGLLTIDGEVYFKGFDLVRSSFPKLYRNEQSEIISNILNEVGKDELNKKVREFKNVTKDCDIFDIMKPSSVKEMSKYKYGQKGTPNHVKSAQNYNKLLELHKIESIPMIDDGDKILYCYLKRNPFGFESIALKGQGEDPEELVNFVKQYIDRETEFKTTYLSKLETIWNDLGWGNIELTEQRLNEYF